MHIIYDYSLPLYHGTIHLYADIIMKHGIRIFPRRKGSTDFGSGFYLTANFAQAKEWAKRRTERPIPVQPMLELSGITIRDFLGMKKTFEPTVLKFEITNTENWIKLEHKIFNHDHDDWKQFVWMMRQGNLPLPQYDWIYGPVADGGLQSTDYHDIRAYQNKKQLAVLTYKVVQYLTISEVITCL
ncbi:hypothetical protein B1689_06425 [Geobacillus sp. 44C]|nr:hypothetical protein B1689_06425 [Geobacillus sp. 44C]QNU35640.1 DUF3990 domain-containing protein [Geobacillus sp. 44C]